MYFSFFAPLFFLGGVQKYPRSSSTLVIANIVAYLQSIKEQRLKPNEKGIRSHYEIFSADQIECLAGDIMLEHPWTAPEAGEISCLYDPLKTMLSLTSEIGLKRPQGVSSMMN